ncbi:MAG: hypothetical protein Sapg2KO_21910 [Saprospiraceae bacterium]
MNFKLTFILSIFICNLSYSQALNNQRTDFLTSEKDKTIAIKFDSVKINSNLVLLEDSLENTALLNSLNAFLAAAQENRTNKWILASEIVETQILIDEIWDIHKNEAFENEAFYKAYLTNIVPLDQNKYAVHIAYIGKNEDSANLRANFELIAHKIDDNFWFSSPLKQNTQNWKTKKIENHLFHYPYDLDDEKIQLFTDHVLLCDKKLENNTGIFHYYMCKNEMDPLNLFGVKYKSDYNGDPLRTRWVAKHDQKSLWVANEDRIYAYDLHDLWHNRLGQVISRREVHRRVDCHIATLYGGIWGITWPELFPMFTEKYVVKEHVDWLAHKQAKSHFITNGKRKNYTDDFVGALLIKKIEQDKGFDGVWKLLMTKRTKEEEEYFSVLKELTGITKESYNKEVQKLITKEMAHLGI